MRSKNILSGKNLYAIQIKVVYIFTTPFVPNEPTFPLYYDFKNKLKGSFIRKTQNKHTLIKFYDRKVFSIDIVTEGGSKLCTKVFLGRIEIYDKNLNL